MGEDSINWPHLIPLIAEGDEAAFQLLFRHFSPSIHSYAARLTHSEAHADEIVQETFVRIWLNRDKLSTVQNVKGWIFTIAANEGIRFLKQMLTYQKKLAEKGQQLAAAPDAYVTPENLFQTGLLNTVIKGAIDAMPPQKRLIYQLSREDGLKPAAIAEQLSISVGTVKNVLSQSLKDIRRHLSREGITFAPFLVIAFRF